MSNRKIPLQNSLIDPEWELIDPTPDPLALFTQYNARFFWNRLGSVTVSWSPRMTSCVGICSYEGRGGMCSVRLSTPLLKLRPRKDLVETLLHEMIHAYLFVTDNDRDRDGHGPEFKKHMYRINAEAGTRITIYHTFHDEVRHYQTHWWKCDGACRNKRPYFGMVKRASARAPGPNDFWWADHSRTCGGTYHKVKEPEEYTKKKQEKEERVEKKKREQGDQEKLQITNYFHKLKQPGHIINAKSTNQNGAISGQSSSGVKSTNQNGEISGQSASGVKSTDQNPILNGKSNGIKPIASTSSPVTALIPAITKRLLLPHSASQPTNPLTSQSLLLQLFDKPSEPATKRRKTLPATVTSADIALNDQTTSRGEPNMSRTSSGKINKGKSRVPVNGLPVAVISLDSDSSDDEELDRLIANKRSNQRQSFTNLRPHTNSSSNKNSSTHNSTSQITRDNISSTSQTSNTAILTNQIPWSLHYTDDVIEIPSHTPNSGTPTVRGVCPLCGLSFSREMLPTHAAMCGEVNPSPVLVPIEIPDSTNEIHEVNQTYQCPVCRDMIAEQQMNAHLDICITTA